MKNEHSPAHPVGTLPRSWEEQPSFGDTLYEWMERAPWVLISGCLHFVIFLIVAAIPWSAFDEPTEVEITGGIEQPEPEVIEEPDEPIEDVLVEPVEDPVVVEDFDVAPISDESLDAISETSEGDPSASDDDPFKESGLLGELGLGGGSGSKYGDRFGGPGGKGRGGRKQRTVQLGLAWLAAHQDPDGKWDADGFMKHDPSGDRTDGAGDPNHDVGVTGLALLAFLADANTMTRGLYKENVRRGVKWLLDEQDRESGLVGDSIGHAYLYDHAIASLALCEVAFLDSSTIVRMRAQKALNLISRARAPYGVWRYEVPPSGEGDTSVTGWMLFALKAGEEAGLKIDREAYAASLEWFDAMTDPGTGRVGYVEQGSPSSRVPGMNDKYPTEKGEAMTAVALLCRFFLDQEPDQTPVMEAHADLLLRTLPEWDPEGFGCDMYYWYYGSYAMYQMGGRYWKAWRKALEPAVIDSQRMDGAAAGSWDPVGPWGYSGGRVYSTATMVLTLQAYYRYSRLVGAR